MVKNEKTDLKNKYKLYCEQIIGFYKKYTSNQFEVMMDSMPKDKQKEFISTQMIIVKVYAIYMSIQFISF